MLGHHRTVELSHRAASVGSGAAASSPSLARVATLVGTATIRLEWTCTALPTVSATLGGDSQDVKLTPPQPEADETTVTLMVGVPDGSTKPRLVLDSKVAWGPLMPELHDQIPQTAVRGAVLAATALRHCGSSSDAVSVCDAVALAGLCLTGHHRNGTKHGGLVAVEEALAILVGDAARVEAARQAPRLAAVARAPILVRAAELPRGFHISYRAVMALTGEGAAGAWRSFAGLVHGFTSLTSGLPDEDSWRITLAVLAKLALALASTSVLPVVMQMDR